MLIILSTFLIFTISSIKRAVPISFHKGSSLIMCRIVSNALGTFCPHSGYETTRVSAGKTLPSLEYITWLREPLRFIT